MTPLTNAELLRLDASALAKLLSEERITCVTLVKQVLAQIAQEDKAGAELNAIISVAPYETLIETAAKLDDFAFVSSKPARNPPVVEQCIMNGLIILAKTNLNVSFKKAYMSIQSLTKGFRSSAITTVGGQTNSVYIVGGLKKGETPMGHTSPCGSSTGSAVGVSAGYSPLGLGTETDGSLVQPTGRAALFAMKPTIGSTLNDGIWTLSSQFDAVIALTKSVLDLALMTELLHTPEARPKLPQDGYRSFLTKTFKGLKIGFADPAIWHFPPAMCPQISSVVKQLNGAYFKARDKIKDLGTEAEYPVELPKLDSLMRTGNQSAYSVILSHDYEDNVNDYLGALESSEVRNLKELIDWNKAHADIEMPYDHADQGRLIKAYEETVDSKEYEAAKAHLRKVAIEDGFNRLFLDKGLDIVAVPQDSKIPSMEAATGNVQELQAL
ncbi:hypothetical protein ACEQ8H_003003 [Pleosporales sp. CAS-2024a]